MRRAASMEPRPRARGNGERGGSEAMSSYESMPLRNTCGCVVYGKRGIDEDGRWRALDWLEEILEAADDERLGVDLRPVLSQRERRRLERAIEILIGIRDDVVYWRIDT